MNWGIFVGAFAGSLVELVEILAVGKVSGWRNALAGAGALWELVRVRRRDAGRRRGSRLFLRPLAESPAKGTGKADEKFRRSAPSWLRGVLARGSLGLEWPRGVLSVFGLVALAGAALVAEAAILQSRSGSKEKAVR